jgi:hypothetical protein
MSMNFFYDLPDDLQEKIYKHTHEIQSKNMFGKIKKIEFWRRDDVGYSILAMTNLLYHLGATQRELEDYHFCLDWLDGKILNIRLEDMIENKYYDVYYEYWDRDYESEQYNGDYF